VVRKGFFLGFLAGSAIASLLLKTRHVEAPETAETPAAGLQPETTTEDAAAAIKARLEAVKKRAEEALQAANEAASEAEQEMRRRYEDMAQPRE
jgi:hypothetical protein